MSAPAERSPLSDGEWHRLHPLTPLFRGGFVLVVVAGIVISNLRDRIVELFIPVVAPGIPDQPLPRDPIDYVLSHNLVLWVLLSVLAVVLVLTAIFWLMWRFHSFRITDDTVEVRSGVLFRSHRRAPLDRVQGVNLTRPMIARLLGMAKLEIVGAGTDANMKLDYLSTGSAEAVRADILRLASGLRLAEARAKDAASGRPSLVDAASAVVAEAIDDLLTGGEEPAAEPKSVVHIPVERLLLSHVFSTSTLWLAALIALIVVGAVVGTPWVLFSVVPAVIGFGAYWVRRVVRALRYAIAPTPDGVRITYGLLTTVTEILPPGRIHAVEVSQEILWRPAGWWRVTVNRLHGHSGGGGSDASLFSVVLPVGTRADVERVLRLLLPHLPESEWPVVFEHGLLGPRPGDPYANSPRRAWWLRPLSWRRNGFVLLPDALLVRRGVIWRTLGIFPLARMQSIGLEQGPLDRLLGVAEARPHTVAGRVSGRLAGVDRDAAVALFTATAAGAVAAAAADRTHRWASGEAP